MLFNSSAFGIFLIIVLALFWFGPARGRLWMLLVASYIFYMWNRPWFILLIVGLTVLNYHSTAFMVSGGKRRKWVLAAIISADLAAIALFKYADFAISSVNWVARYTDKFPELPLANIYLPLGISFFTFQLMSYTIDVWRGMPPEKRFRDVALYIAFFPQLVAGPIMRSSKLIPQFHAPKKFDPFLFREGVFFLTMGLVKKIVFADTLGTYVTEVFSDPAAYNTPSTVTAVYAYAYQIYFDFSGYTDIAIGCGRMLGYNIMVNFNLPYLAHNVRDFWRRWHISLSTWLRDYLYIPLGGSRGAPAGTYVNLMITMALGGLWHGASWKFVIWGVLHGVLLAANRLRREFFGSTNDAVQTWSLRWWFGVFVTFHLVCIGWVFFRGNDMSSIWTVFERISAFDTSGGFAGTFAAVGVLLGIVSHLANGRWNLRRKFLAMPAVVQMGIYALAVLLIALFATEEKAFIYFQF